VNVKATGREAVNRILALPQGELQCLHREKYEHRQKLHVRPRDLRGAAELQ
jgi:hypothetical protein